MRFLQIALPIAYIPMFLWGFLGILRMGNLDSIFRRAVTPLEIAPQSIRDFFNWRFFSTSLIIALLLSGWLTVVPPLQPPDMGWGLAVLTAITWLSWMVFLCLRNFPPRLFLVAWVWIHGFAASTGIITSNISGIGNFAFSNEFNSITAHTLILSPAMFSFFLYRLLTRLWDKERVNIVICAFLSLVFDYSMMRIL